VAFGLQDRFHGELVEAMYAPAQHAGYELVLTDFCTVAQRGRARDDLLAYRCEAVIVVGPTMRTRDLVALSRQLPTVLLARRFRRRGGCRAGPMTSTALAKHRSTLLRKGTTGSCTSTAGVH